MAVDCKKITKIRYFFTIWSLSIWIIYKIFSRYIYVPTYLFSSIENCIVISSIIGSFMVYKYHQNIIEKEQINKKLLFIIDLFSHVLPFLYIYIKLWKKNSNDNNAIYQIIHSCILCLLYILTVDFEKIYSFSGWNKYKLITVALIVWSFVFYFRNNM